MSGFASLVLFGVSATRLHGQDVVALAGSDRSLSLGIEEMFSLGSVDAEAWQAFSTIEPNDIGFDATGNLHILDELNRRVVIVDRSGGLIRRVGRSGDGPGEFRRPTSIAVHGDGSFTVFDVGHQVLMFFDSEGTFTDQRRVALEQLPGAHLIPDGRGGVFSGGGTGIRVTTPDASSRSADGIPVRRYGAPGEGSVSELFSAWQPPGPRRSPTGGPPILTAFQPSFSMAVTPDGIVVVADSVNYRLKVASASGGLARILTRPIDPEPVTREDQRREQDRRLRNLEANPNRGIRLGRPGAAGAANRRIVERARLQIADLEFATHVPVINRIAADGLGRLWVERTGDGPASGGPIDIIQTGDRFEYLGTILTPPGGLPYAFGPDGLAAYVELDELGVPIITVAKLRIAQM